MNLKQTVHSITTHIQTEQEIEQAALKLIEKEEGKCVCTVFSNSEDADKRRVSIFLLNGQRVYCCDWPKEQAFADYKYISPLIDRFDCWSRKLFIEMT